MIRRSRPGKSAKEDLPLAEDWHSFHSTWNEAFPAPSFAAWHSFFSAFKAAAPTERHDRRDEIEPTLFASFFAEFSERHRQFHRSGAAVSVWEVAGLGTDEVRGCSVLAWLLDRYGSHGQGDAFLRCFLDCVSKGTADGDYPQMPTAADIGNGYRTRVESRYDALSCDQPESQSSRVDIEIDGPGMLLFIEAKIYAGETNNQLERYLGILRAVAGPRNRALVFVTPTGRLPQCDSVSTQGEVRAVSWKQIAGGFSRHLTLMDTDGLAKDSFAAVLIKQFCDHITHF